MKHRPALALAVACAAACTPPAARPPAPSPAAASPAAASPAAASPAAPEAQLSALPPAGAEVAPPAASDATECITPTDPELDKESPWHKSIGEQLALELPNARRCTRALPQDTRAELTLRLVFGQDGRPLSQHVVSSSSEACAVAECIKQELADVNSGKLAIERGSIDLALVLEHDKVPQRLTDPSDPLADDDPAGCVDPEVARLSRKVVRELVGTTHAKLKECYGQALMRRHDAAGTVTFEFVIGQEGEMASVQARESTLYDCGAIQCMLAELRPLRFPAPVGRGVRVVYPIKYVVEQPPVRLR